MHVLTSMIMTDHDGCIYCNINIGNFSQYINSLYKQFTVVDWIIIGGNVQQKIANGLSIT